MLPLTPMTTIGSGSCRGVRLFLRSCLHNTVSLTLIFITAVCLLLSAYCFIFCFCSRSRQRIIVSSLYLGCPLTSGSFPRNSLPNMSQFGLTPVVACIVALYALIPRFTSSDTGLPSKEVIRAVFFILCINLSTSPLASAHPGVTFRCLNPSSFAYSSNL